MNTVAEKKLQLGVLLCLSRFPLISPRILGSPFKSTYIIPVYLAPL